MTHLMNKNSLRRAAWLIFALWLGMGVASGAERGLLWKMEVPGAAPSYLFGTIHTDDARVTDFSPELKAAMQNTESFMMEILPQQDYSAIFLAQGTLREWLSDDEITQVLGLADMHALQEEMALRMKPWLLATIFSLPEPQSPFTQDILLYSMAGSEGEKLLGLENTAEHFGALDDISMADQIVLLKTTLAQSQEKKEQEYDALLQAYLSRETDRIAALDEKSMESDLPEQLWQQVKVRLLDRRNVRMAERIARQAAVSPVFVAVGAAHLAGDGGLIARLRNAGFKLVPVE